MSVAIVIATHGWAAEQLLKTSEMLIGKQENVGCVDFTPSENADLLMKKYEEKLKDLDISQGVLFLVDTWGGSPFNAASRLVEGKENWEVITGVNIPMLVELLMAKDDGLAFEELVDLSLEVGRLGVKSLKRKEPAPKIKEKKPSSSSDQKVVQGEGGHPNIVLARIDDRLIHGQVATRWTKETNVSRIIVVSDEVAKDEIRSTLLKQVAPPGVTAHVIDVDKMVRVYNNPKYANERVMLLFTNPSDILRLSNDGVPFTSINVGGMAYTQGKIQVTNAISLDKKDIEAFKALNDKGIELEARKVSNDSKVKVMDLVAKAEKEL